MDYFLDAFVAVTKDSKYEEDVNYLRSLAVQKEVTTYELRDEIEDYKRELERFTNNFNPYHLDRVLSNKLGLDVKVVDDAHYGGKGEQLEEDYYCDEHHAYFAQITIWADKKDLPSLKQVREAVRDAFPAEHCTHEYDCCGGWYRGGAGVYGDEEFGDFIIKFNWHQNI